MRACLVGLVAALGLGSSVGCGLTLDLEPEPDGGSNADLGVPPGRDLGPGTDLGRPNPCEGAEDGGLCAIDGTEDGVCIDGSCVPGECGDGFVTGTELCDDGNTEDGDGCQANCRPGCTNAMECPSTECAMGSCEAGRCVPNPVADGTNCLGGICRSGVCTAPDCGNGLVDDDEACDDGNSVDDDGCDSDCTPSCESAEDCRDGILCNGAESCVDRPGGGAVCMSADILPPLPRVCEYCDELTGRFELSDADGDGFSAIMGDECGPTDCNDSDPTIYPGAPETTAGVDSNCDGSIAADTTLLCYLDADMDGYGDPDESVTVAGDSCPTTFVPAGAPDCNDENGTVNPGQIMYFHEPYCGSVSGGSCSYDYDCDGREERRIVQRASCLGTSRTECEMGREGWTGRLIPDCGETGTFGECQWTALGCITSLLPMTVVQSCR